ncbi:hypothetical protein AB0E25_40855 [Streptomyces bobili]|uniref:hypothetical protein n=1 Tax=Streptomyces bobili TaxID=67280 RepID=UPI0033C58BC3
MRQKLMFWAAVTTVTLGAAMSVTACTSSAKDDAPNVAGGSTHKQEAGKQQSDKEVAKAYEKCMREQGFTVSVDEKGRFKDPGPDNPDALIKPGIDKAMRACIKQVPGLKQTMEQGDKEALEQARGLAKCLRANGFPSVPDPDPRTGTLAIPASEGEQWTKAMGICGDKFPDVSFEASGSGAS